MRNETQERSGAEALTSLTELVKTAVKPAAPDHIRQGLDKLTQRLDGGHRHGSFRWLLVGAVATSMLAVFAGTSLWRSRTSLKVGPALAYTIEGGSVVDGGYLRESGRNGITLRFSEGTRFVLASGTRGHLRSVDTAGAHIAIEHGTALFQVTPRVGGRWLVDVGPFLVNVKGTVFRVAWDAPAGRFELSLRRGQVSVSGPVSGGDITLRAGQRLVVNLPKAETLISEGDEREETTLRPGPAGASAPHEQPATVPERPTSRAAGSGSASAAPARTDVERRWATAVASGEWDRILADVDRMGVKTTIEKASSADLFALADAARYRRRPDLARDTLLALRRRFPDSPRSGDVAFLLGRVEESRDRGAAQALRWYDDYLAQAQAGTFASEALGRKMILTSKLQGHDKARPVAEEYLRRFPSGTYAGTARALRGP
jgi:hypothetical protein